jgi:sulfur carrier protein
MELIINGRPTEAGVSDLEKLLQTEGFQPERKGVAVAVNGTVVPRSRWPVYELHDGDRIEVISAMQGG